MHAAAFVAIAVSRLLADPEPTRADLVRLQGTWVRSFPGASWREVWEFRGHRYTMTRESTTGYAEVSVKGGPPARLPRSMPEARDSGSFRLDATRSPKVIVYRRDGDGPEPPLPDPLRYDLPDADTLVQQEGWVFGERCFAKFKRERPSGP